MATTQQKTLVECELLIQSHRRGTAVSVSVNATPMHSTYTHSAHEINTVHLSNSQPTDPVCVCVARVMLSVYSPGVLFLAEHMFTPLHG